MKKMLFAAVAAVGLTLTATFGTADAAWAYRTVYQWDAVSGRTIVVSQPYWVPNVVPAPVVIAPAPVVVAAPPIVVGPVWHDHFRAYYHGHYHR